MNPRDGRFRARLLQWFAGSRRDLPWRLPADAPPDRRLDPYRVLVSELMLQQTQVSAVVPYFKRFTRRFPTIRSLAQASEQDVLRLWQGLGYYARARNLHATARHIVEHCGGKLPSTADELIRLPGIGRYTAAAVASIAFDEPAAAVDGNVARVLARLERIDGDLTAPKLRERLWSRAQELVDRKRPGDFNSAMMELGATVCTPRAPRCPACPVAGYCQAQAAGVQENLPTLKKRAKMPLLKRNIICLRRADKWLIEQRPAKGRWASMWQFVTIEANRSPPTPPTIRQCTGTSVKRLNCLGIVTHSLTHRRYEYTIYVGQCSGQGGGNRYSARRWMTLEELKRFPLPRPHVKVAELLRELRVS